MPRKRRGRGEGGIYQRSDGLWCASVSGGYRADGRRRRRVIYGATKREVQDKLKKIEKEEFSIEPSRLMVAQYLERWQEDAKQTIAPTTAQRYEQIVRLHLVPYLGHHRLTNLAPLHVAQLFSDQEKAGASPRNRQLSGVVLHRACRDAVRLRLIPFNPCSEIAKPKVAKRKMMVWDATQAGAFLKTAQVDRLHSLYVLAITAGMRQGELFALAWTDIDFDSSTVMVQRTLEEIRGKVRVKEPKTVAGSRRIHLPQVAIQALHEHRKQMLADGHAAAPVFCDTAGGYLRKSNFSRRSFEPLLKSAKVPVIRFHDLRHTAATLLLLQGEHPKVVSERLGHARIEITLNTYSHVLPTMQKGAADKLDRLLG